MNLSETTQLIAVLKEFYPNHPVTNMTATAYQMVLADVPYELAMSAAREHASTNRFFPTVAELRAILAERVVGIGTWESGFDEVMACVKDHGSYAAQRLGSFRWSSAILAQTVRHIGYETFCMTETDNVGTLRAQFRDAYERERQRQIKAVQVGCGLGVLTEAVAVAVGAGGLDHE